MKFQLPYMYQDIIINSVNIPVKMVRVRTVKLFDFVCCLIDRYKGEIKMIG